MQKHIQTLHEIWDSCCQIGSKQLLQTHLKPLQVSVSHMVFIHLLTEALFRELPPLCCTHSEFSSITSRVSLQSGFRSKQQVRTSSAAPHLQLPGSCSEPEQTGTQTRSGLFWEGLHDRIDLLSVRVSPWNLCRFQGLSEFQTSRAKIWDERIFKAVFSVTVLCNC